MKRKFTFLLLALLALAGFKSWGQETLTVCDGTTTNYQIPVNTFYFDTPNSFSQFIIPSAEDGMEALSGKSITQLQFHISSQGNLVYQIANTEINCSLKEVESETMTGSISSGLTEVFSGKPNYTESVMTIPFDTPYNYEGGNLLISITVTVGSGSPSIGFKGKSVNYNAAYCYDYQDNFHQFLPKTTITYAVAVSCPAPTGLAASNITANGATISWTDNGAERYDLAYGVASTFDLSNPSTYTLQNNLTTTSVTLSGLTAETEYKCAVKAHCSDDEESAWSDVVSFMPTATKVLTVCDGNNTNAMIPIYGGYADSDYKSQFIFPAQYLESMQGGIIKSMTFYAQQANVNIPGTWSVYLSEVDGTTLSGLQDWNDLENVVEGQTMTISGNKLTVNFPTPFEYNGGNLLIGFNETVSGTTYPTTTWYGVNQSTNTAYYRYFYYSESTGPIQFLPKTTFAYEDGAEKFAITLTQPEDAAVGTISADYEQAAAGTTVTLSANFNLGYTLNYFMVDEEPIVGNTFEMPEHDVIVSVTYNTLDMYAITFDPEIDDDIISISATYNGEAVAAAPAGTVITLGYSNLDEGYIFNYWTLNGAQLPGSTFEMPEEDAVIGVNLTERERYAVTIDSDVQDYITANPSSDILDGTTVTLTISPATGYVLTELHVLDEGGNEQDVTITENSNIRTFTMPESDVTVSAVFSRVYNIEISMALVGGNISQMSTQGTLTAYPAGTQVFLSAIPDTDYSFVENSFIVTRADGETGPTVTFSQGMYSFIMPESNVTVSATFNKTAFAVSKVITPTYSGSFSISQTAHVETGETVTLSNFYAYNGYYFDFEDVNSLVVKRNDNQETVEVNNYGNIYQFAMPASDVTVTATFKDRPRYEVVIGTITNGTVTFSYGAPDDHKYMSGETVYLEVNPASSDYTLKSITATPSEGSAITPQPYYGGPTYYFTMPDFESEESTVTVTATFRQLQSYTINYYVNGQLDRTMQCQETHFVNNDGPQNVTVPAGMTFEGWGIAKIDTYVTEKPAVLGNAEYPTQNYNLYAVLRYTESVPATSKDGETWVEVTSPSDLNNGDQVIIVKKSSNVVMCDRSDEYSGSFEKATISIYNNEITSLPSNAVILTAIDNSGNWKFSFNDAHVGQSTLSDYYGGCLVPYGLWDPSCDTWTIEQDGSSVYLRDTQFNANLAFYSGYFTCNQYTNYQAQLFKKYNPFITTNYYMTSVLADGEVTENTTAKNIIITTGTVTVDNNIVLTMNENGFFRNKNAANFVFGYGAQLIHNNAGVLATMKKHINGTDWYTISSPLAAASTEFADVTSLIPTSVEADNYDLYRLNEADGMWENARVNEGEAFTTIDKGRGYIYSKTTAADIAFAGEINVAPVECNLTIGAANGFNLIGNPFTQNIKLTDVVSDGTAELAKGFYVLNNDNTWGTKLTDSEIKPLQGFLVQATTAGSVTISKPAAESKGERSNEQNTNIELIVSNGSYTDNAYAMFGEGTGLNKVSHRNAQAPMIYIPQDGEDFAIAFMDENTTVFPLNFKAMTTGKYSISLKPTDDINTLVLIDNMTGEETNMLLEESYSFNGSPADSDGRFTVKLSISHNNGHADSEHFVYQNGSELVVNGEGTLQIFDVLGRVVISEEVHGQTVNVGGLNTGAYIVRLTGESVMTQKIVVR